VQLSSADDGGVQEEKAMAGSASRKGRSMDGGSVQGGSVKRGSVKRGSVKRGSARKGEVGNKLQQRFVPSLQSQM
jgi:hypothetical protein